MINKTEADEQQRKDDEVKKKLQENLLASEEANLSFEMNTDEFVREWYDAYHNETSSIRAYIERIISSVVDIETNVPDTVLKYAGTGIDSLRDLLTNFDKLENIEQLNTTERHVKEKLANILLEAVTKDISNVNHVLSVLTVTGVIHGSAAGILTPMGGFALAALAWGAVGFSSMGLYRASRYYASPTYQLEDKLTRYNKIDRKILDLDEKIKKLQMEINGLEVTEVSSIQKLQQKILSRQIKMERWINRQETLKQEAINIIQFNTYNAKFHNENAISEDLKNTFIATIYQSEQFAAKQPYQAYLMPPKIFADALNTEITEENKNLMLQLKKNQRDLVISRTITTMSLAIMAVGMTLTAVAPFCAHGAPIVMAVGFALIALGGAMQLGQTLSVKLVNAIARKHAYTVAEKDLIADMNAHSAGELKNVLPEGENLKYYLSFKLAHEQLKAAAMEQIKQGKLRQMPTDAELEADWYKHLNNKNVKERKQILDKAKKIVIKDNILRKALGLKAGQPIPASLSEKAKTKIINRACRHALRQGISDGVRDFFKNTKEKISVESKNGVMKIQRLGLF